MYHRRKNLIKGQKKNLKIRKLKQIKGASKYLRVSGLK